MSEGASRFFNSVEDAALLSEAELTDFFVYYLTIEAEVGAANATNIAECFKACDLTPPVRTAPHLSEGLKSKPQKFVKVDGGYKLQRHYRETLSKRLRVEPGAGSSRASSSMSNGLTPDESKLLAVC